MNAGNSGGAMIPATATSSDNAEASPMITARLAAELPKLNPEIAAKVRDVVDRKTRHRG